MDARWCLACPSYTGKSQRRHSPQRSPSFAASSRPLSSISSCKVAEEALSSLTLLLFTPQMLQMKLQVAGVDRVKHSIFLQLNFCAAAANCDTLTPHNSLLLTSLASPHSLTNCPDVGSILPALSSEKQPVQAKRVKVGEEAEITFLPISSRAAPKSAHLSSVGSILTPSAVCLCRKRINKMGRGSEDLETYPHVDMGKL